jgi:hypothetical protein
MAGPSPNAGDAGIVAAGPRLASIDLRKDWWTIANHSRTGSCLGWG